MRRINSFLLGQSLDGKCVLIIEIDQILDRLAGYEYYCFLDEYSGYDQIVITPGDQEKMTFTYPYGIFAFRRMSFRLCNAPASFQRCMMAIFFDMVEEIMEVFMDDISVFRNSFDHCLHNFPRVLQRCEEKNLVLNWENCTLWLSNGSFWDIECYQRVLKLIQQRYPLLKSYPLSLL